MRTGYRRLAWWRWVLVVVCVGFAGVWILTEFRPWATQVFTSAGLDRIFSNVVIRNGGLGITRLSTSPDFGLLLVFGYSLDPAIGRWWFTWERRFDPFRPAPIGWTLTIPLWMPGVLLAALTTFSWRGALRERRQLATTHCVKCGYDRRGLSDAAVCPECGAAMTQVVKGDSAGV